ncbi:MAG: PDDEXK nuclease domain-containing protein [Spirosomaceae bacterium]|jgi:predicted nuclease of restriction endonuclease-like (RecB) superfamily|nr:PDDEXK nuclease domain-containing protein [Spirosomataceae bacterium]
MNLENNFYENIREILNKARIQVATAVNSAMVQAYWEIGRQIVEEEQNGKERAEYGTFLIKSLSERLTKEFGNGFGKRNLFLFKQFYLAFPKVNALRTQLGWTHYRLIMRVENPQAREFYIKEASENHWTTRLLERQIGSFYYERLLSSNDKKVLSEKTNAQNEVISPKDILKDPYIFEFLGLSAGDAHSEKDVENSLIKHLQKFLLELGKGFAFVAQQKFISTETSEFFIDLVFYNYILKCFVLIDLKIGKLTHQDIGQMDMYVRMYDDLYRPESDNPTIGLILCQEKDETIVKYSILKGSEQIFASKYKLYLPTEQELVNELNREIHNFNQTQQ